MLFREQGITIASILAAIGMTVCVLAEALLPGGGGGGTLDGEKGLKECIRNKVKTLSSFTKNIRRESERSIAWYHWSDSQLDSQ